MNHNLLEIVACPRCHGRLHYQIDKGTQEQRLICRFEHIYYSIQSGIPILLPEKAIPLEVEDAE